MLSRALMQTVRFGEMRIVLFTDTCHHQIFTIPRPLQLSELQVLRPQGTLHADCTLPTVFSSCRMISTP